jgi:PhzF family phenazine biosynthesis protein
MQKLAGEMNQAETAFTWRSGDGLSLRWFTPASEVDLCGHATLAASHILWETGRLPGDAEARFSTRSGKLVCRKEGDNISMDFPAERATSMNVPETLLEAFESHPIWFGKNRMDYLIELQNEDDVSELQIDSTRLSGFTDIRGFIFTARCTSGKADFVSRFFAPGVGVVEDWVTGSAHCCLGPYWSEKLDKQTVLGYQCSARGGYVEVEVLGDRVVLRGKAVTVLKGMLV